MRNKKKGKNFIENLKKERMGYVMKNDSNGIEIKCTEEFVDAWKARGFKIVSNQPIKLVD
ncbi:hypothetical protein M3_0061 [Lysinibacillus phage vB_LfM_LysYB1]|nr:hypothetical protein M3_0061 [Lysinibacillus phage vB_LfM_LysYB1]WAB25196.1 hypothetical protein M5_0018 [Lysinibacillus phage vB_LfM_LysYB2]